ncbi:hypothetical protein EI555_001615 [Monodon monoceros]|uniref:Phosphatidic acid phosphatase type 2/haloperoxidase domain-containing protein n=1 Tax=Monodon monoceros TaxID=40151 RepID=A0A4U1EPN0_MONMO|nr:hypothetical protein EI555_001615 [Monodon monoceros]
MEGTLLPSLALSPKMTTRESPKVCNAQRGDRWPRRTLVNSDMALTRGTLKKSISLPRTVLALPELVVRYQCLWPGDPRRTTPVPSAATLLDRQAVGGFGFVLSAAGLPIVLNETGLLVPHIQGFFCNDTTIGYPRVAHYIIEDSALIEMGFFISIFTISLGELIRVKLLQLSSPAFMSGTYTAMIYKQLGTFIFGGLASCSPTSITKMTTGHLQPHFLATKSFYSVDASIGMYSMVYLVKWIAHIGASPEHLGTVVGRHNDTEALATVHVMLHGCLHTSNVFFLKGSPFDCQPAPLFLKDKVTK